MLIVADLHYSLKQFDWLCERAADYDFVIIVGDMLDMGGHADLDTQMLVVEKYLGRIATVKPIAVCSGNHDVDEEVGDGGRRAGWLNHIGLDGLYVDYQGLALNGARISICPWWEGPDSRRCVAAFLQSESEKRGGPWIWMCHAPPAYSKISWNGRMHSGDPFLVELIGQHAPDIVLCGHIHSSPFQPPGSWMDRVGAAWVFNPGREIGPTPPSIVIDLVKMEATWQSSMDSQTIRLTP
jgi:Icc-related predicted phosphoesterase